jgi:hypothetical protein
MMARMANEGHCHWHCDHRSSFESLKPIGYYARPEHLQLVPPLILSPIQRRPVPSLAMEGGTYLSTYSNLPTLGGGWTDLWQQELQDSLAHPHDLQIDEEAGSSISCDAPPLYQLMWMVQAYSTALNLSLQSSPTQGIDGGWTEDFECPFPLV